MKITSIKTVEFFRDEEVIVGDDIQLEVLDDENLGGEPTSIKVDNEYERKEAEFLKNKKSKKVFLGGTTSDEDDWREEFIKGLTIDYFNPLVDDWNDEAFKEELRQKEICDYLLFVITPYMKGTYSIAEIVDASNTNPNKAILCILKDYKDKSFDKGELLSLSRVASLVESKGVKCFWCLSDTLDYLNN